MPKFLEQRAINLILSRSFFRILPVAGASFLGGISAWVKSLTDLKNAARVFIEISKKKKIQSDKKNTGNTNHKRFEHHRLKMKLTLTNVSRIYTTFLKSVWITIVPFFGTVVFFKFKMKKNPSKRISLSLIAYPT